MTRWAETLRARLAAGVHRLRGIRGHLDGYIDNALVGWVVAADSAGPVQVGVFTSRGMIAEATANLYRGDVRAAGIGTGYNGFSVPLDAIALRAISAAGSCIAMRTLGPRRRLIGRHVFGRNRAERRLSAPGAARDIARSPMDQLLYGAVTRLAGAEAPGPGLPAAAAPALAAEPLLFADTDPATGRPLPTLMTAYTDYIRHCFKQDLTFDTDLDAGEAAHFLHWYLAVYSTLRGGLRVPLSRAQIAWLNELVVIPGQRQALSRATWSFLQGERPLVQTMDFSNPAWVDRVVYRWAIHQARALNVEDVLVPPAYVRLLASVPTERRGQTFAPSRFMLRFQGETPALKMLDLAKEADRKALVLALVTLSAQRPDYLRYVPPASLEAVLDGARAGAPDAGRADAVAPFTRYFASRAPGTAPVDREALGRALRAKGFDLESRSFVTVTAAGNRLEAAMLPVPEAEVPIDVQVIGPFEKASGLGQATRLSAKVLEKTGLAVNCVDFDLDNPSPEGFSRVGTLAGHRRARINLLHLNGESAPRAFAYQPDVFSGAYNIGYFFWEIDSPATCHYLAMSMLDEIWVASDYGLRIYQPHSAKPVTNVGMCFEDLPPIDRADARRFLRRRFGFSDSDFVFLAAFDSFSFLQRKNPLGAVQAFSRAFAGQTGVRLVIKTQNRGKVGDPVQRKIWEDLDRLIRADGRVVAMDETLGHGDLLRLKTGCDAYVSLHRSEGWGFGLIEAMSLGVPVIATAYSGNMDFCSDATAFLVGYREAELGPDDYIFVRPGQKWAEPDIDAAAAQMRAVWSDPAARETRAAAALANVRAHFIAEAIAERYAARLGAILKGL